VTFESLEKGIEAVKSGKFFGLLKVDITPPSDLYVPVLPDNSNGKLLFHLEPMKAKTWTSIEIKKPSKRVTRLPKYILHCHTLRYPGL
jgi:hypothetical protein